MGAEAERGVRGASAAGGAWGDGHAGDELGVY